MPVTNFIQRDPDDGKPATSETKAWLAYDAENLYVIFVCKSDTGELRARYTKRDDIFADDFVGVLLDTFDDRQHAFEFSSTPTAFNWTVSIPKGRATTGSSIPTGNRKGA